MRACAAPPASLLWPPKVAGTKVFQFIGICIVFFITGLTLNTRDLRFKASHAVALLYGLLAILIITPATGFGIIHIPMQLPEFSTGQLVVAMPMLLQYIRTGGDCRLVSSMHHLVRHR